MLRGPSKRLRVVVPAAKPVVVPEPVKKPARKKRTKIPAGA